MEIHSERNRRYLLIGLTLLICLSGVCFIGSCCGAATWLTGSWTDVHLPAPVATIVSRSPFPLGPDPGLDEGSTSGRSGAARGDVRILGTPPETMDPALASDLSSAQFVYKVFSGLVALDEDLEIRPELAERWEISDDGRVYTFYLRGDATFHDGQPITAEDFRYSLERASDPDLQSVVAGAYLGLGCTWHSGLSASAPLVVNTPNNFLIKSGYLTDTISTSQTIFTTFNIILFLI